MRKFRVLVGVWAIGVSIGTSSGGLHVQQANLDGRHWQQLASADLLPGRSSNSAVWTGKELIVFGGEGMNVSFGDGARFNLAENSWRPLSNKCGKNKLEEHTGHSAVWTGKEMIIWGGFRGSYGNNTNLNDGACYDPIEDSWRLASTINAPSPRFDHSAVWTGHEMLIWGGYTDSHARYSGAATDAAVNTGGKFNPETNTWKTISSDGAPSPRFGNVALWTGSHMIIWGGFNSREALGDGAIYDPLTDAWKPISLERAPQPRTWAIAVWDGKEMIVWGGSPRDKEYYRDGARYNPQTDAWTPISSENTPKGRVLTKGVWTGKEMLLWGGVNDSDVTGLNDENRYLSSGGVYNPAKDLWRSIPVLNGPSGRLTSGVWTGKGLLIFGGYNNTHLNETWYYTSERRAKLAEARTRAQADSNSLRIEPARETDQQTQKSAMPQKSDGGPDAVDRLVGKLAESHGLWQNGASPKLDLASTATLDQVVSEVFKLVSFDSGNVTSFAIRHTREVQIPDSLPGKYTAILVDTNLGGKIVLVSRDTPSLGWWTRVYEAEPGP